MPLVLIAANSGLGPYNRTGMGTQRRCSTQRLGDTLNVISQKGILMTKFVTLRSRSGCPFGVPA